MTVVFSALALIAGLASCAARTAEPRGEIPLNVGSLYEPQNLDNVGGGGQGATEALAGNVYEGLFKITDSGAVEKSLAESYLTAPDGLTYTFHLRPGVRFHSGDPLTAADVKYSLERILAASSKSSRKSSLGVIKTIAAPDDTTVVVTLSSKSISFVYNLGFVWIVNDKDTDPATQEDGTGPYRLAEWRRGATLTLTRSDRYWGAPAKSARVVFHYFTDAAAMNNALLTGAVDVVTSEQSPDALAQFNQDHSFTISEGRSTTKLLLAFNDRVPPFNDARIRRAVSSAIDDHKLLNAIWNGHGMVIGSMVPPTDPWYEDLTGVNPYDVALAKRLLTEAGKPSGFTFTLDTPTYDPHPTIAAFVVSELAKVGITAKINSISADEWYSKVFQKHDFTATLQEHVNDRDIRWYADPNFYWGYDNKKVSDWVIRSESAGSAEEQIELLRKVARQIAEDAASDWLYLNPQIVVSASKVTGYPVNGLNAQFFVYDIVKR
ncbi:ABC transporter substrate-binding protein [Streptosporangiaceae bacterium NEAU-GS5]|nr:ABC transporter substrate-binding protein [Streptosporangiaceae bacterium NEAU-GS5]